MDVGIDSKRSCLRKAGFHKSAKIEKISSLSQRKIITDHFLKNGMKRPWEYYSWGITFVGEKSYPWGID